MLIENAPQTIQALQQKLKKVKEKAERASGKAMTIGEALNSKVELVAKRRRRDYSVSSPDSDDILKGKKGKRRSRSRSRTRNGSRVLGLAPSRDGQHQIQMTAETRPGTLLTMGLLEASKQSGARGGATEG